MRDPRLQARQQRVLDALDRAALLAHQALTEFSAKHNTDDEAHPYQALYRAIKRRELPQRGKLTLDSGEAVHYWQHGAGFTFTTEEMEFGINVFYRVNEQPTISFSPFEVCRALGEDFTHREVAQILGSLVELGLVLQVTDWGMVTSRKLPLCMC